MLVITFGLFVSVVTAADLVEKRRDAFKANAQSMKAMRPNIKAENFDAIAINAQKIADWAAIMPGAFCLKTRQVKGHGKRSGQILPILKRKLTQTIKPL